MPKHGLAGQGVQDFGQIGAHPLAHARRKDDDVHVS
jgi:hypothetical protein